jgi:hypothetical protein
MAEQHPLFSLWISHLHTLAQGSAHGSAQQVTPPNNKVTLILFHMCLPIFACCSLIFSPFTAQLCWEKLHTGYWQDVTVVSLLLTSWLCNTLAKKVTTLHCCLVFLPRERAPPAALLHCCCCSQQWRDAYTLFVLLLVVARLSLLLLGQQVQQQQSQQPQQQQQSHNTAQLLGQLRALMRILDLAAMMGGPRFRDALDDIICLVDSHLIEQIQEASAAHGEQQHISSGDADAAAAAAAAAGECAAAQDVSAVLHSAPPAKRVCSRGHSAATAAAAATPAAPGGSPAAAAAAVTAAVAAAAAAAGTTSPPLLPPPLLLLLPRPSAPPTGTQQRVLSAAEAALLPPASLTSASTAQLPVEVSPSLERFAQDYLSCQGELMRHVSSIASSGVTWRMWIWCYVCRVCI